MHVQDPARVAARRTPARGCACTRPARRGSTPCSVEERDRLVLVGGGQRRDRRPGGRGRAPARRRGSRRRRRRRCRGRRSAPAGSCPSPEMSTPTFSGSAPPRPRPTLPATKPGQPPRSSAASAAGAESGSTTAAKPRPRLNTRRSSSSSTPSDAEPVEHRRPRPRSEVDLGAEALGELAGEVARDAAAGDVRHRPHVDRARELADRRGRRSGSARAARRRRSRRRARPACRRGPTPARSSSRRTSEKPFACGPLDGRPMMASPACDAAAGDQLAPLGDRRRRSRPGRTRPAASCPGCSAVSPPSSAQPAWRQPSAMPSTSSATTSTSIWPQVITSMKKAGRQPEVSTSFTLIATRSTPRPAWRPAGRAEQHLRADAVAAGGDQRVADRRRVEAGEAAVAAEHLAAVVEVTAARIRSTTASEASRLDARAGVCQRRPIVAHRISTGTGAASKRSFARRMSAGISVG